MFTLKRQLDAYNTALAPLWAGVDLDRYMVPLLILYGLFSFIPTAVGVARHGVGIGRIALRNAAAALAPILLWTAVVALSDLKAIAVLLLFASLAGGLLFWISTFIDATTGPVKHHAASRS